jgi:starch synthase (maltosyl-transferring)
MRNQSRVVIVNIHPQLDDGYHPIKAIVDETIHVTADVLCDGHDIIASSLLYKNENERVWREKRMSQGENNVWQASFLVEKQGFYYYKIQGWVDYALNWQHGIERKIDDGQQVTSELLEGVQYLHKVSNNTTKTERNYLEQLEEFFEDGSLYDKAINEATSEKLHRLFINFP